MIINGPARVGITRLDADPRTAKTTWFDSLNVQLDADEPEADHPIKVADNVSSMTVSMANVNLDALTAWWGGSPPILTEPQRPVTSVMFERIERMPDLPPRPARRRGLWAWVTLANARAARTWRKDEAAWIAAGRPMSDHVVRTYIPSAVINEVTVEGDPS